MKNTRSGNSAGGLKDGPLQAESVFYFRVSGLRADGSGMFSFHTAVINKPSLTDAYAGLQLAYPGATITAVRESEFAADGLPVVSLRGHAKDERRA